MWVKFVVKMKENNEKCRNEDCTFFLFRVAHARASVDARAYVCVWQRSVRAGQYVGMQPKTLFSLTPRVYVRESVDARAYVCDPEEEKYTTFFIFFLT